MSGRMPEGLSLGNSPPTSHPRVPVIQLLLHPEGSRLGSGEGDLSCLRQRVQRPFRSQGPE